MKHFRHLVCAAALSAAFLPGAAHAAPQPEVLAYGAGGGIYVSSPPGAAPTKVVPQGYDPAVSADGTRLAWIATAADDHPHVFVGAVAGGGGVQVTNGPAYDATPAWSPSGGRLAFTRLDDDGNEHIAVVDADGTDQRIFATRGSRPTWSPDGRFIAFRGERGLGLESVDAAGRGWASLGRDLGQPSWSPDGAQIVTVSSNVRMVDVPTGSVRSVIHDASQLPARWFEDAAFNAAGDRLYVRRVDVRD
jgi:Tol biopolymer transport system component